MKQPAAILVLPVLLIYTQYRKLQYSSSNNTGNTSIVKHTILEGPVFFIQQYCKAHNTGNTSIVHIQYWMYQYRAFTILEYQNC
jgi:hypothetical protein